MTADEDSLLQIRATPIFLAEHVTPSDQDVDDKILSLAQALSCCSVPWTVITWELHDGITDTVITLPDAFDSAQQRAEFGAKHHLLCPVSELFPIRFMRPSWHLEPHIWYIASFRAPASDQAIVLCVLYHTDGAVFEVRTMPKWISCPQIRTALSVKFGTFLRQNGHILSGDAQFAHGDVLECHAAGLRGAIELSLSSSKVQLCLSAVLPAPAPSFDVERDACLLLQAPSVQDDLVDAHTWEVDYLPTGLDLHPTTFEALHLQHEVDHSLPARLELYVDGASMSSSVSVGSRTC